MRPGERNVLVMLVLGMITRAVAQGHGTNDKRQNLVSKQMTSSEKNQI